MKEILGENMNNIFIALGINAKETYDGGFGSWDTFKVWEITEAEYDILCEMTDEQFEKWSEAGSWWISAEGSVMGTPNETFTINDLPIIAWRDKYRVDDYKVEWEELPSDEKTEYKDFDDFCDVWFPKKYTDIFEYFCSELGASTKRNVCALSVDLAKYNNITMTELFRKYGGSNGNN